MKILKIFAICLFCYCTYKAISTHTDDSYHLTLDDIGDMPQLMIGDVIFRLGIGTDSQIIANMSESNFSHVGLVIATNPIQIIHASVDDNKDFPKQVIISDLNEFLSNALSIAIKRYDLTSENREQIPRIAMKYVGRAFVLDSIDNKDTLYCTTLVAQILNNFISIKPTYQYIVLSNTSYYFPESLYANTDSILIYSKKH